MSKLTEYLGIPEELIDEFEAMDIVLMEDENNDDEFEFTYYFYVPDDMPDEILDIMGWNTGDCINDIPSWAVGNRAFDDYDDDEDDYDDEDDDYDY